MNAQQTSKFLTLLIENNGKECKKHLNRFSELLRNPDGTSPFDWFVYCPQSFNDALDIKLNFGKSEGWTQSAIFNFTRGDILYDNEKGYLKWEEALKNIAFRIEIISATPSEYYLFPKKDNPTKKTYYRNSGHVKFCISIPTKKKTELKKYLEVFVTQDDFVRFLIFGTLPEFQREIDSLKSFLPTFQLYA